jgi:ABC-type glutathione transport system ATPase component
MKLKVIKSITPLFSVKELTTEQVLQHPQREYNPATWERIVNGYKNENPKFYEKTSNNNSYPEIFVMYTSKEGINFMNKLSYSVSMSNSSFCEVYIDNNELKTIEPLLQDNNYYLVPNNKAGRDYMLKMSKLHHYYTTNMEISKKEFIEVEI